MTYVIIAASSIKILTPAGYLAQAPTSPLCVRTSISIVRPLTPISPRLMTVPPPSSMRMSRTTSAIPASVSPRAWDGRVKNPKEVLDYIVKAALAAGYQPGSDIKIALDVAASELYQEDSGMYYFPGETKALHGSRGDLISSADTKESSVLRSTEEMIALYEELCKEYPIISIEDGLNEDDWDGWKKLTERLGDKVQLVGDDLFVTNTGRLSAGIRLRTANAILVKVNQIGTLSEAFAAIEMAHKNGYKAVISHRSGETEDTIIADIAVAVNAGQIKTGAPCRTDRVSKYNQLLRIEEELGGVSVYEDPFRD